jgi:hypothetical protein
VIGIMQMAVHRKPSFSLNIRIHRMRISQESANEYTLT